ncbi:MAG: DUF4388 domain-containing protein [Gemmatimonadaceae bacterium]
MAIKGSLKEASLPDVLQLLTLGQKTGCLSVTDRNEFGHVYFDRGRIVYASIVNRRDRLGDILLKNGIITQDQLEAAVKAQAKQRDKRIGELLVDLGALSLSVLNSYIQLQIEEAVYYLFRWTHGTFSFDTDVVPDCGGFRVSINPESLLLEGARRVDEWSLIEKKVPSFDIIFDVDRARLDASDAQFTKEQQRLLPLIDGRRDVAALIEESGLGEFEAGKALYGLATAGFLHRVGRSEPSADGGLEARLEEHQNLGIAFYRSGMLDEAAREFRRVAELRPQHEGAKFYTGLVHLREGKWAEAARLFESASAASNASPATLHNLAYALERLGRNEAARSVLEEAVRRGGSADARIQLSLGILRLKLGDVDGSDSALQTARSLAGPRGPSPVWFHYAALAAAFAGDVERAFVLVRQGIEAHPRSAPLRNMLAVVEERRGHHQAAMVAAEEGLKEDSELPQLHRNAGDGYYQIGRSDDALDAYQRAVKLAPGLGAGVYHRLGTIHYRRQERQQAVSAWERGLALDPTSDEIRASLDLIKTTV